MRPAAAERWPQEADRNRRLLAGKRGAVVVSAIASKAQVSRGRASEWSWSASQEEAKLPDRKPLSHRIPSRDQIE